MILIKMIMNNEKIYFQPGEVVELRQDIDNKPLMIIKSVDKSTDGTSAPGLLGITCIWFNTLMELQSARFSTKDLSHVD